MSMPLVTSYYFPADHVYCAFRFSEMMCHKRPCENGGTCEGDVVMRTCHCVVGATGNDCETGTIVHLC